jgi:AraC-like DNA-binding protein/quercetin dioxygenase-like cupin family protein
MRLAGIARQDGRDGQERREGRDGLTRDYDPPRGVAIATLAYDYKPDFRVRTHAHGSDQLLFAPRGAMEVTAGRQRWLIPPQFAFWIPVGTKHSIRMCGAVSMRTIYLRPGLIHQQDACRVIQVPPLLRELIVEAVATGQLRANNAHHRTLQQLLVRQIERARPMPMSVTMPVDKRAVAVAEASISNYRGCPPLPSLCRKAGVSVRTVERAFQREVGLTFELWRRQARLLKAIELLVGGASVKEVSFEVGYEGPSTFVEMFRKTMGTTPGAWKAASRTPALSPIPHV